MDNSKRTMMKECWDCIHKRPVPGDCHIQCVKPDVNMTGNEHGIKNGWFMYPLLFDPTWKTKLCQNFELKAVNPAISSAASREN